MTRRGQAAGLLMGLLICIGITVIIAAPSTLSTAEFSVRTVRQLTHKSGVSAAAWSPDGKQVATLSELFRRVTLWDTETGTAIREFSIAKGPPGCWSLAFTADGKSVVTTADSEAGNDAHATVALWNSDTGELARFVPGPFPDKTAAYNVATVFAVSRSGEQLAVGPLYPRSAVVATYTGESWTSPSLLPIQGDLAETLAFSPDGQKLAVGTILGRLFLFDLAQRKAVWSSRAYEHSLGVRALAYSPDGRVVATGSGGPLGARTGPGGRFESQLSANPLAIWDAASGSLVRGLPGSTQTIESLSWSADGRVLAATQDDNTVRFWSMDTPEKPAVALKITGPVTSVAFAPAGMKFVATGNKVAVIGELRSR